MAISISEAMRNALADAASGAFDGGTGRVNIYTGSKPASPATAASGTLLATLSLASDAAAAADGGVATFNAITDDAEADATGTAGWFRIYNTGETDPGSSGGASDSRLDGTCGVGSGDLQFDDADIEAGGEVSISSFTIAMPGA